MVTDRPATLLETPVGAAGFRAMAIPLGDPGVGTPTVAMWNGLAVSRTLKREPSLLPNGMADAQYARVVALLLALKGN